MNKDLKIYLILVVIVILIILGIFYVKSLFSQSLDEKTAQCIANNTVLYTATGCTHCAEQEGILGNYLNLFTNIDCVTNSQKCLQAGIDKYPTWIINEKRYEGVLTIQQLKELTGCGCEINQSINSTGGACTITNSSNSTCTITTNTCEVKK